jgi:hypothetical protein
LVRDRAPFGSFRSPNTIASVGQALWQAVTTSPSRMRRSSLFAPMRAAEMRWMQYVHFSMTPRLRTVTSGLFARLCSVAWS